MTPRLEKKAYTIYKTIITKFGLGVRVPKISERFKLYLIFTQFRKSLPLYFGLLKFFLIFYLQPKIIQRNLRIELTNHKPSSLVLCPQNVRI